MSNHKLSCPYPNQPCQCGVVQYYPRIRDLPEVERAPFTQWLAGQTRPVNDMSAPQSEWDAYYGWDYARWKAGLPVID